MKSLELSERELALLNALTIKFTVKDAAFYLQYTKNMPDMTTDACYGLLDRLRDKQLAARKFVNTMLSWRKKNPTLKARLTPKIPVKEEPIL